MAMQIDYLWKLSLCDTNFYEEGEKSVRERDYHGDPWVYPDGDPLFLLKADKKQKSREEGEK